jgi:hypothetical protein
MGTHKPEAFFSPFRNEVVNLQNRKLVVKTSGDSLERQYIAQHKTQDNRVVKLDKGKEL